MNINKIPPQLLPLWISDTFEIFLSIPFVFTQDYIVDIRLDNKLLTTISSPKYPLEFIVFLTLLW